MGAFIRLNITNSSSNTFKFYYLLTKTAYLGNANDTVEEDIVIT